MKVDAIGPIMLELERPDRVPAPPAPQPTTATPSVPQPSPTPIGAPSKLARVILEALIARPEWPRFRGDGVFTFLVTAPGPGRVRVNVARKAGRLRIELRAAREETSALLDQDLETLRAALAGAGIHAEIENNRR